MPIDNKDNAQSSALTDEGLRCPACEYNLTGLAADVCPECGGAFDREELLLELSGEPMGIPIWSNRSEHGAPTAFTLTLLEILIHPVEYFSEFPRKPNHKEAIAFSRWCLLLAAGLLAMLSIGSGFGALQFSLIAIVQVCTCTVVCERLAARLAFLPASNGVWNKDSHNRNLSMLRMARGFLVPCIFCLVCGVSIGFAGQSPGMLPLLGMLCALGVAIYWCVSMVRVAVLRRPDALVRAVVCIPFSALTGILSAAACTVLLRQIF